MIKAAITTLDDNDTGALGCFRASSGFLDKFCLSESSYEKPPVRRGVGVGLG
jgi:hypothetical protein